MQVKYRVVAAGRQQLQVKLLDPLHPRAAPQAHSLPLVITAAAAGQPEPELCWAEGPGLHGSAADGTGGPDRLVYCSRVWVLGWKP